MARLPRAEVFAPDEVAIVHVINRTVRRCFLLGDDPVTGKNYDHRKLWIEQQLQRLAAAMGIDLLGMAILSNHFHLILRSRPDVVETWDDTEVARRWLMLCPIRKDDDGSPAEPSEAELNGIRNDPDRLARIRSRLSDISWWMRLLSQNIAQRANREDEEAGKFWQSRFRAVRILDETALLACAAYVDLNPIRAAMAETLEESDFTSVQRRIQALEAAADSPAADSGQQPPARPVDAFLSPIELASGAEAGPAVSVGGKRCSDKGFLAMSLEEYLALLDWTARRTAAGKRGATAPDAPPIFGLGSGDTAFVKGVLYIASRVCSIARSSPAPKISTFR